MAPKIKFTKEQIIQAAFEIAEIHGIESITIRKVADHIGSSIAPIYVNFNNVRELKEAVLQKTIAIGHQLIKAQQTGSTFMDIGIASLKFAREYPVFFRDVHLKPNKNKSEYNESLGDDLIEQLKKDPELQGFTNEELQDMLLKMRIFQTGLSTMIANNQLSPDINEKEAIRLLQTMGEDLIIGTHIRKENKNE
ncbi:MAG TPA: TetR/AcrR family transcriptional regulator [Bacillota bacterium]|nr:TetR/AcrR family transcriptional regulator [Bacillota bacterium]